MVSQLIQSIRAFDTSQCADEAQRLELIAATKAMLARLQTPTEVVVDTSMETPLLNTVVRILIDKKVFEKWTKSGDGPKTVQELGRLADTDPVLLRRFLIFLVSKHYLDQVDEDTFALTSYSASLAEPEADSWSYFFYNVITPLIKGLPEFFQKSGYTSPHDPLNAPFAFAVGKQGQNLFQIISSQPEFGPHFNRCMTDWGRTRTYWLDFYPSETLIDNSGKPIIVDVAGGIGHDLERFTKKHPGHSDRQALAERPDVVARAICHDQVEKIEHDFFTPMPIQGARAYYMKEILHNWADEYVIKILANIKPAMTPGYSRILVNDIVVPRVKPRPIAGMMDLLMMSVLGAMERTEDQWRKVIEAAGLKLVKIWSHPTAVESIIEIELATA